MKKRVTVIVTIIAAAALITIPTMLAGSESSTAARRPPISSTESVFSVRVDAAERQTLQAYIEINGDIITEQQVSVVPDTSGKLSSLKVEVGSVVRKGQVIAEVDPSKPGVSYSMSPVYSPISGTITSTPLAVGSTVTQASNIAVVSVMENLEIEALIPEREVGQLKVGLTAEVTLEAFPGEIFSATVIRVSPVLDPNSRTKKIVLTFDTDDSRINAGMFARIKLNTRTYADVITVPSNSLVTLRGSTYVYVLEGADTVRLQEVSTGVSVDDLTEIKTGLAENDIVIIQGQQFLSDNAKVRVVNAGILS
ncbi:efflux RND transporter periplasmic adaptor subunit [Brucepastera parasyntrophica]|uniref:efflux RND transporter periplasmic adaptor subunit n=1 Tax=Brucepastera parasyntrophica TaxID=2880008 RepID=UPI00210A46A7|nr:efflux RND transporter periplasmic adaptor subunit [Brucepastera parasyntrophica]ULQ60868.1 efflux RND transporter periplasmic adaptor subunit [Brucepastera parasyntrophica]